VASGEGRARAAAEAAVSSPLLEDINLSGANGILVNVTAGLDLAIGEFEEVGRIVKEFASENATVVVGTVIDPEMTNEIRVTVVATGLGRQQAARVAVPPGRELPTRGRELPQLHAVKRERMTASDYQALDKPTIQRQRAVGDGLRSEPAPSEELLDIPAFLRRQAD
jgi:cell division protein FtsZ